MLGSGGLSFPAVQIKCLACDIMQHVLHRLYCSKERELDQGNDFNESPAVQDFQQGCDGRNIVPAIPRRWLE